MFQNKLNKDIAWTLGSFAILASSGIIINIFITWLRDVSVLGVFNLTYAVYIVVSQIAVCGLQYSVMRHSALHENNPDIQMRLMHTAIATSFLLGLLAAMIVYVIAPLLGNVFHSPLAAESIKCASFGLILFPLNKVLLSYFNGLRKMKAFAFLQSLRYIVVMIWVIIISASKLSVEYIAYGFFVAEFLTSICAFLYIFTNKIFVLSKLNFCKVWFKTHIFFGSKSLVAGMFVELNSRVDVLLIGIFLSERQVGIYSFMAMLVDGLYHMLAMVKINFNPILVSSIRDKRYEEMMSLLHKSKKYIYPITFSFSIVIIFSYYVLSNYILPEKGLQEGLGALAILCFCLSCISAYIPFDNLLLTAGYPGYQTAQHMVVVCSNIILNVIFIPLFGINGAAFSTGMSYFVGFFTLYILANHFLKWNILKNSKHQMNRI